MKILRQPGDIASFGAHQLAILKGLWPALKPGGRLLYVTCSLLKAENDSIIATFTDDQESIIHSLSLGQGRPTQFGWQTLPHPLGGDGLFFSLLEKPGEPSFYPASIVTNPGVGALSWFKVTAAWSRIHIR